MRSMSSCTARLVLTAADELIEMKRREFLFSLAGAMAASGSLRAQQKAMPVIGFLGIGSPGPVGPYLAAFRQGLSETGYIEGQNG